MQSPKWEFDLMGFPTGDASAEHIAGEVKKTATELDVLLRNMQTLVLKPLNENGTRTKEQTNAYNKYLGLSRRRAPIFWAIGPGGLSHVFKVSYLPDDTIRLTAATEEMLKYSKISSP